MSIELIREARSELTREYTHLHNLLRGFWGFSVPKSGIESQRDRIDLAHANLIAAHHAAGWVP